MMIGPVAGPADPVSSSASTTEDSGSRRIDTAIAPIKAATAGVSAYPGRGEAITPMTAPRNRAGKVGPPRKLPMDRAQATPLQARSTKRVARDKVVPSLTRDAKAVSPENSTVLAGWSVIWA